MSVVVRIGDLSSMGKATHAQDLNLEQSSFDHLGLGEENKTRAKVSAGIYL